MDGVTLFGAGLVGGGLAILGVAVFSLAQRYGFAPRRRPASRPRPVQARRMLPSSGAGPGGPGAAGGPAPGAAGVATKPGARSTGTLVKATGRVDALAPPTVRERRSEPADLRAAAPRRTQPPRPFARNVAPEQRPGNGRPDPAEPPRPPEGAPDGGLPRAAEVYARAADVYARAADVYARAAEVRARTGLPAAVGEEAPQAPGADAARAETVQLGPVPAWSRPVGTTRNDGPRTRPGQARPARPGGDDPAPEPGARARPREEPGGNTSRRHDDRAPWELPRR